MQAPLPRIIRYLVTMNMVVAGIAVLAMLLHVVLEVVMRELEVPFSGTLEIVSYWYMVGLVFLAIPAAQAHGEHIQVELFTAGLSPRRRAVMDIFALLVTAGLLVLFTQVSVEEALRQTSSGAMVEAGTGMIIVWPTRWLVPFSMGSTIVICLAQALSLVRQISRGDFHATQERTHVDV